MRKFDKVTKLFEIIFVIIAIIVWFLCAAIEGEVIVLPRVWYFEIPELNEFYVSVARGFDGAWARMFFPMIPLTIALYVWGWNSKKQAIGYWIHTFANLFFALIMSMYVFGSIFLTKTISILCIPLFGIIIWALVLVVFNRRKYTKMQLKREGFGQAECAIACFALILTVMVVGWQAGNIQQCVSRENYERKMQQFASRYKNALDFEYSEDLYEKSYFDTLFSIACTNKFNTVGENFSVDELVEAYQKFENGETGWSRLDDFVEAYYSIDDEYDDNRMHSFMQSVRHDIWMQDEMKSVYDYTMEEVEEILEQYYLDWAYYPK